MSILRVEVHAMSVKKSDGGLPSAPLQCTTICEGLLAWEQDARSCAERVLVLGGVEFSGNVFLTGADGAPPAYSEIPELRFYERGLAHVASIAVAADGTPWVMCVCDERCGTCAA